ncbi:MAG: hypothetical protein KME59_21530 [Trichormus sp. ATA11-4-KO1]|jgi:hypothetical protein|nr:hypothetical protein [Trichormus sp. ATA11-4-KO1]
MAYLHSSFEFAGIPVDGFIIDGEAYTTLTGFANGLGISRQSAKNWYNNHCRTAGHSVRVGKRQVPATAYPVSVIGDFLDYRVSLGDKRVTNLYSATFRADLERTIKETNGTQVTAAQHEGTRANLRQALDLAREIEFSELTCEELQPVIDRKNALVDSLDPQGVKEYMDEVERIWGEARARRESLLPLSVQRVNQAIYDM